VLREEGVEKRKEGKYFLKNGMRTTRGERRHARKIKAGKILHASPRDGLKRKKRRGGRT
jgi:hypothetical protein